VTDKKLDDKDQKKLAKKVSSLPHGLDTSPAQAKPDAKTIIAIVTTLLVAFGIQWWFASDARSEIPSLRADVQTRTAERDELDARLTEVVETNKDELLASLRAQSVALDDLLPYTGDIVDIEPFEIQLAGMLRQFGLEGREQQRGSITQDRDTGLSYRPIQVAVSGPRDSLFTWIRALRGLDRLATVHNLSYSIDQDSPTAASAQMQLRLWFSEAESIEMKEADAEGRLQADGTITPRDTAVGEQTDDPDVAEVDPQPDDTADPGDAPDADGQDIDPDVVPMDEL
jgi:hypothetical protein